MSTYSDPATLLERVRAAVVGAAADAAADGSPAGLPRSAAVVPGAADAVQQWVAAGMANVLVANLSTEAFPYNDALMALNASLASLDATYLIMVRTAAAAGDMQAGHHSRTLQSHDCASIALFAICNAPR
jgi:hypothetical protein